MPISQEETMTDTPRTLTQTVEGLRHYFNTGKTKDVDHRIAQLNILKKAIFEHEKDIVAALKTDLSKSGPESFMTEINVVIHEIEYAVKHLKKWARPRWVKTPLSLQPALSYIYQDPLGVVLIIGPWNYPFNLTLCPLVGAIAAGNTVLLKPSEVAPAVSGLIRDLIGKYFDPSFISVVEGGAEETTAILTHRFDSIFYTGGEVVGKIVMTAAARHLTPVTLELGGKSPCIVDEGTDITLVSKRIAWGKFMNAGQTCVAPDYLLIHRSVKQELVAGLRSAVKQFFGNDPRQSPSYGRIINEKHVQRLEALTKHGEILFGGETDRASRYMAPTLIHNITAVDPIMNEEIFGPILPVITYEKIEEALSFINARPKPLALYLFSNDPELKDKVLNETSSGGVCINDTVFQIASTELPFGGVGPSGMGSYHGKASFTTFSHQKSVLKRFPFLDPFFRYAPFKPYLRRILRMIS